MELRQIKHLIAVAETGSFTKASERVSISQPALSASIAKLEAEFEVQLLERRRTKVVPTAAGLRFLERASSILLECSSVKADCRRISLPQPLRIGVLRTLPSRLIADLARSYRRARPGCAISLFDGCRSDLVKRFQDKKVHALITTCESGSRPQNFVELFTDRFVVAVPHDHHFAREKGINLSQLNGEPFITRSACETFQETSKVFVDRGIRPRITFVTDQDDRALNMVAAGVGLALVPEVFDSPGFKQIPLLDYDLSRTVGLQWSSQFEHEHLEEFIRIATAQDWQLKLAA